MITNEDIIAVTQNIFATMLELETVTVETSTVSKPWDPITGCIRISGEWTGAVVIQCSESLARTIASRYLEIGLDSISESDLRDVFAELTNMIGGNIKGQVLAPSCLSLPTVTSGHDFEFHLAGSTVVRDLALKCDGEVLRVTMCEAVRTQLTPCDQHMWNLAGVDCVSIGIAKTVFGTASNQLIPQKALKCKN